MELKSLAKMDWLCVWMPGNECLSNWGFIIKVLEVTISLLAFKCSCKIPAQRALKSCIHGNPYALHAVFYVQLSLYLNTYLANPCLGDTTMPCLIKILLFFFSLLVYVSQKVTVNYVIYGEVTKFFRICLLYLWCEEGAFLTSKILPFSEVLWHHSVTKEITLCI